MTVICLQRQRLLRFPWRFVDSDKILQSSLHLLQSHHLRRYFSGMSISKQPGWLASFLLSRERQKKRRCRRKLDTMSVDRCQAGETRSSVPRLIPDKGHWACTLGEKKKKKKLRQPRLITLECLSACVYLCVYVRYRSYSATCACALSTGTMDNNTHRGRGNQQTPAG